MMATKIKTGRKEKLDRTARELFGSTWKRMVLLLAVFNSPIAKEDSIVLISRTCPEDELFPVLKKKQIPSIFLVTDFCCLWCLASQVDYIRRRSPTIMAEVVLMQAMTLKKRVSRRDRGCTFVCDQCLYRKMCYHNTYFNDQETCCPLCYYAMER